MNIRDRVIAILKRGISTTPIDIAAELDQNSLIITAILDDLVEHDIAIRKKTDIGFVYIYNDKTNLNCSEGVNRIKNHLNKPVNNENDNISPEIKNLFHLFKTNKIIFWDEISDIIRDKNKILKHLDFYIEPIIVRYNGKKIDGWKIKNLSEYEIQEIIARKLKTIEKNTADTEKKKLAMSKRDIKSRVDINPETNNSKIVMLNNIAKPDNNSDKSKKNQEKISKSKKKKQKHNKTKETPKEIANRDFQKEIDEFIANIPDNILKQILNNGGLIKKRGLSVGKSIESFICCFKHNFGEQQYIVCYKKKDSRITTSDLLEAALTGKKYGYHTIFIATDKLSANGKKYAEYYLTDFLTILYTDTKHHRSPRVLKSAEVCN